MESSLKISQDQVLKMMMMYKGNNNNKNQNPQSSTYIWK